MSIFSIEFDLNFSFVILILVIEYSQLCTINANI